jgi:hypothetical protein
MRLHPHDVSLACSGFFKLYQTELYIITFKSYLHVLPLLSIKIKSKVIRLLSNIYILVIHVNYIF